ncbi:NAD(P)-dependent oxidoreductase [Anabaena sp. FACHB-1237]|uniref:SDR family oxidoreductase n=1 Tax=Anabaena sp. FACHB-1237 TaxID=2692769 RepID=UPI001680234E|nr:NAD(P)-dependent oxidoreductase [Anabaena sp. FACHB-1237]MBD2137313.1 NAD(P)-dependent oxidoreductase [Anabaena sp. FACHB-1237]
MKKLLVTGVSGFLGWHLCQIINREEWEIYGTYAHKLIDICGTKIIKNDLTNLAQLTTLFQEIQPDAVIHLAAKSQPNYCQLNREESYKINVTASCNIAGLCADNSIPLVFTSTDLVFDGLNPPYQETDKVSPVNIYGEQKVAAEIGILNIYPSATICRMPLMFGNQTPTAKSFIQPFIEILKNGQELNLFTDEFRTPVSANTAAKGLLLALEKVQGIIHLGGKERISRYDFGKILVEVLQLPGDKLKSCLQSEVKMAAPRPKDVSLHSEKAFNLGYEPLSIREELEIFVKE